MLLLILNVCRRKQHQDLILKDSFLEELKSYRDFDLHYPSELPLSSFISIPEDNEVGSSDVRQDF